MDARVVTSNLKAQQNWLQLSPSPSPVASPGLSPRRSSDVKDELSLNRTNSNSSFLSNVDPSRRPMPARCPTTQPAFHNMTAERRLEAAAGIRFAAYNH